MTHRFPARGPCFGVSRGGDPTGDDFRSASSSLPYGAALALPFCRWPVPPHVATRFNRWYFVARMMFLFRGPHTHGPPPLWGHHCGRWLKSLSLVWLVHWYEMFTSSQFIPHQIISSDLFFLFLPVLRLPFSRLNSFHFNPSVLGPLQPLLSPCSEARFPPCDPAPDFFAWRS